MVTISFRSSTWLLYFLTSSSRCAWETALKLCAQAGFRPKYLQVAENAFAAMNLVSAGCAVAFMSERMKRVVQDGVVPRPFDPPIILDLHLAWKHGTPTAATSARLA